MTPAEAILRALGGANGSARCPVHNDKRPSLSVRDGDRGVLLKCHAGCDSRDVYRRLVDLGIIESRADRPARARPDRPRPSPRPAPPKPTVDQEFNRQLAHRIWTAAETAEGSRAVEYRMARGIWQRYPCTIRFAPHLKHHSTGLVAPALVCCVQGPDGHFRGVQRVYLKPDCQSKLAALAPKMSLGPIGGGTVRLTPPAETVWLTEGVEDALAATQITGRATWACLGTSGVAGVQLPEKVRTIVLALDGDDAGREAADKARHRLEADGRKVLILALPEGRDWCDLVGNFDERSAILEHLEEQNRGESEVAAAEDIWPRLM